MNSNHCYQSEKYLEKYEEALSDLSESELEQVANLSEEKLNKWIFSPKKIRPFLLKKWSKGISSNNKLNKFNRNKIENNTEKDLSIRNIKSSLDAFRDGQESVKKGKGIIEGLLEYLDKDKSKGYLEDYRKGQDSINKGMGFFEGLQSYIKEKERKK